MLIFPYSNFSIFKLTQFIPLSYYTLLNLFKTKEKSKKFNHLLYSCFERVIQQNRQTKFDDTIIVIDDTAYRKRMRKNPSVSKQYIGNIGKVDNGCCHVFSANLKIKNKVFKKRGKIPYKALRNNTKIFMSGFKTYNSSKSKGVVEGKYEYKSKIEIAIELIRDEWMKAKRLGLKITHIVFDSWYPSKKLLNFIILLGLKFVCEVKKNRKIKYKGKSMRVGDLVTIATREKYFNVILPEVGEVVLFFMKDRTSGRLKAFITNDFESPMEKVRLIARIRYMIEYCFKQMKSYLNMGKFHFTNPERVEVYITYVMLLYNFYEYLLQLGILKRQFGCTTLDGLKVVLNKEFIQNHMNTVKPAIFKALRKKMM